MYMNEQEIDIKPEQEIDITPETSIYRTFQNLPYKPETAIAEFIDNSTQSFFTNKQKLVESYKKSGQNYVFNIVVRYLNTGKKETSVLEIYDNAFGMNFESFNRAISIDKPPPLSNRSQFGMGLKAGGLWFAKELKIKTSEFGSETEFSTKLDIDELISKAPKKIPFQTKKVSLYDHYTIITLKNLNKTFNTEKQKKLLKKTIANFYRRDINSADINIHLVEIKIDSKTYQSSYFDFDGNKYDQIKEGRIKEITEYIKPLVYMPLSLLTLDKNDPLNTRGEDFYLKQEINKTITYDGKEYLIKGWVGILDSINKKHYGFTLFRNDRIIIGGSPGSNYRPSNIFNSPGSYPDILMVGEFDMESFGVSQSKDSIQWDGELEEKFNNEIFKEIKEIRKIASNYRINRNYNNKANEKLFHDDEKLNQENQEISIRLSNSFGQEINIKTVEIIETEIMEMIEDEHIIEKNKFDIEINGKKIDVYSCCSNKPNPKNWLKISKIENSNTYSFILYLEHLFLKPFSKDENFIIFMRSFVYAYALSLIYVIENKLPPEMITLKMNKYFA